jgi:cell wall assembly regulator SMI1
MTVQQILQDLNDDFFLDNSTADIERRVGWGEVNQEAVENKWIGYPPAREQEINAKEEQLGTKLPPSYKQFLLSSNGFRNVSPFLNNLFSLEQVDWARNIEEQWWLDMYANSKSEISDKDYFDYSDEQDTVLCRDEYLPESLKVSEWYDGMCIFLNPIVRHGKEWEVLEYATWYPGTKRYRSFEEFLIKTHELNIKLRSHIGIDKGI